MQILVGVASEWLILEIGEILFAPFIETRLLMIRFDHSSFLFFFDLTK